MGVLVGLRAKLTGLAGVMITASHNPKHDNGVKIIECDGAMLDQTWEPLAEELVNSKDLGKTLTELDEVSNRVKYGFMETIFYGSGMSKASFAMDTRESSPALLNAAMTGCQSVGVATTNFGLCTTPQLHWLVSQNLTDPKNWDLYP